MNINIAGKADFALLPGVGPSKAERIVAYRNTHGYFAAVDDLIHVSGIGPKTLKRIQTGCPLSVR